jgi:hypothetical protein
MPSRVFTLASLPSLSAAAVQTAAEVARKSSWRVIRAQPMRAILLAKATAATLRSLLASSTTQLWHIDAVRGPSTPSDSALGGRRADVRSHPDSRLNPLVSEVPFADFGSLRSVSKERPKSPCFARLAGRSRSQPRFFARNQGFISRMAVQGHQLGVSLGPEDLFGRSLA